ncbi:efflux RND transporter periplasmic adaptor subunit [Ferirhizobium litorale]|uniref:Efflux RND transporter periplasmic adaptor subunit n=1 Tax=Ferirhizobium litorale TaxID=2927786 RepID=A0AAE3QG86_9HYPH|nr:efflux RND transporter periplasmic adaptor subunit [Fererhizobium litorale]MDI7922563.1 efflux RND transporter periplasmic adaptor subunit [Fererhizobium litorale]
MRTSAPTLAVVMIGLLLLTGCEEKQGNAAPQMPPTQVGIVTTKAESLPIKNDLPGRIAPTRLAEVRPRVSGIIVERVFEQGSRVKEGDVLYRIDPAPLQVQVDSADATLRRAKAAQLQARQTADRQEQLRKSNVSTAQQYDEAIAQLAQADAEVAVAEAGLASARLNLQYASVTAPISGRIGRALITEGALVNANGSEALATIQQLDPVYADFTQSANDLLALRRAFGAHQGNGEADVELLMDDGSAYPHHGRLLFSEATVDATTGQVTLRAEFPNPDSDLLPGMYVRVVIQQGVARDAIAIPQQAIQRDTAGNAQVYVVKEDKTAEIRKVITGRVYGSRIMVSEGLKPDEQVIVEGFQKIRPGAAVAPAEWKPEGDQAVDKKTDETAGASTGIEPKSDSKDL